MENFKIYENIDKIDVDVLTKAAGTTAWPTKRRYTVDCNGVIIKISAFYGDYYKKISRGSRDEHTLVKYFSQHTFGLSLYRADGNYPADDPEITYATACTKLTSKQVNKRVAFITAIANLINNQETMEAIAYAAKKKKNGELHKGAVVKIASAGLVDVLDGGFILSATNKDAHIITLDLDAFWWRGCDGYEFLLNDFVSTPHEGLKLSELIAESLGIK